MSFMTQREPRVAVFSLLLAICLLLFQEDEGSSSDFNADGHTVCPSFLREDKFVCLYLKIICPERLRENPECSSVSLLLVICPSSLREVAACLISEDRMSFTTQRECRVAVCLKSTGHMYVLRHSEKTRRCLLSYR